MGESGGVLPVDMTNNAMTEQEIWDDFRRGIAMLARETRKRLKAIYQEDNPKYIGTHDVEDYYPMR